MVFCGVFRDIVSHRPKSRGTRSTTLGRWVAACAKRYSNAQLVRPSVMHSEQLDATVIMSEEQLCAEGAARGVRLAAESPPALQDETAAILRSRLRAVAGVLVFGLAMFLVRGFMLGDTLMQWIRMLVFSVTGGCLIATSLRSTLSLDRLRVIEWLIFGSVAVQLGSVQLIQTLRAVSDGKPESIAATTVFCFLAWVFLVMMYGMFIPNTWRRAMAFIVPASLIPIVLTLAIGQRHQIVLDASGSTFVGATLMSVVSGVCSLFGTHIVNSLQREAFEARQYGQYRLVKPLGSGAMGEVYLAEHRLLKRPSAIKLIRPGTYSNREAIARFEAEVQVTATLSHWNTVEIFDYGRTDDGTFYYVMEYLPGLNLEELVTQHGPMPVARAIHFLRQVCGALEEAHTAGLVHRDIKPANVIAAKRGGVYDVAKLVDFGIARRTRLEDEASLQRTVAGSPRFMSPEQAASPGTVDGRADLYSLGVTGFFLIAGRYPFEGNNVAEVLHRHASEPVPPLTDTCDVPSDVSDVISRCLQKDPADRFENATSMSHALDACALTGEWTNDDAAVWWHRLQMPKATEIPPDVQA